MLQPISIQHTLKRKRKACSKIVGRKRYKDYEEMSFVLRSLNRPEMKLNSMQPASNSKPLNFSKNQIKSKPLDKN